MVASTDSQNEKHMAQEAIGVSQSLKRRRLTSSNIYVSGLKPEKITVGHTVLVE
jgi:hypothetical protein